MKAKAFVGLFVFLASKGEIKVMGFFDSHLQKIGRVVRKSEQAKYWNVLIKCYNNVLTMYILNGIIISKKREEG